MIIKKAELAATAVAASQYPKEGYPEAAFVGRSNVGKSSLINSLLNRKSLARISSVPGKTRTINFYNINDEYYFVDLPGYGYAKVSKEEKKKWAGIIEGYLFNRNELKIIFLLVDIRHEPTEDDKLMLEWIKSSNHKFAVIATKSDKLSKNQMIKNINIIKKSLMLSDEDFLIPFSSQTKQNREEILDLIESIKL
ncbi:GTP-binding protein [Caloramator quimbayensis]|uniref:Probable GTP-binding protein EngB n=1 Tax=Caloramator quimbayensis TaxID=1147123 RepID=A0A1T4XM23_9CLOT|nr:ribosome biogenesis GTP-binding protein YihA/YsxC [Caloramator quimbayensis]SKA90131.1 GTP-binding protein [Caloramator quimbayensis]